MSEIAVLMSNVGAFIISLFCGLIIGGAAYLIAFLAMKVNFGLGSRFIIISIAVAVFVSLIPQLWTLLQSGKPDDLISLGVQRSFAVRPVDTVKADIFGKVIGSLLGYMVCWVIVRKNDSY